MCGRFVQSFNTDEIQDQLDFPVLATVGKQERFNIAPQQKAVAIGNFNKQLSTKEIPWGVPISNSYNSRTRLVINSRIERLNESHNWSSKIKKHWQRVLIPINGYYEWRKNIGTASKVPYYLFNKSKDNYLFLAAILDENEQFSIITQSAAPELNEIHHRMPVYLTKSEDQKKWLSNTTMNSRNWQNYLERDIQTESLAFHCISNRINNVANDDSSLIKPVAEPPSQLGLF